MAALNFEVLICNMDFAKSKRFKFNTSQIRHLVVVVGKNDSISTPHSLSPLVSCRHPTYRRPIDRSLNSSLKMGTVGWAFDLQPTTIIWNTLGDI